MKFNFDPNELTKEKSLWDVYLVGRQIRWNWFNKTVIIIASSMFALYAFYLQDNVDIILSAVIDVAELTFGYVLTVLGFLIAGFAIFATHSKPEMFLRMMDVKYDHGITYLKYDFSLIMMVFIYYFLAALMCIMIIFLGSKGGPANKILELIADPLSTKIRNNLIRLTYVMMGTILVLLVILLKSFIFNVYHIIMSQLRWEIHCKNNKQGLLSFTRESLKYDSVRRRYMRRRLF